MMLRVFIADWLKLRRSWVMWLTLLGPVSMVAAQAVNYGLRYDFLYPKGWSADEGFLHWVSVLIPVTLMLGTTLLAAIASGGEHDARAWKQMLVQPVHKAWFLLSKVAWLMTFLCFSAWAMVLLLGAFGRLVGLEGEIPWRGLVEIIVFPALSAFPFLVFQLWLSILISNPAWPIAIGVAGTVMGPIWAQSDDQWMQALFWTYPSQFDPSAQPENWIGQTLLCGAILLALAVGHWVKKEMN